MSSRRTFINTVTLAAGSVLAISSGCNKKEEDDIPATEDLMREHGLLNRVLLIYDTCSNNLVNGTDFRFSSLLSAAGIIKNFIENYHEKLEENYLFPRFEKAGQQTDLVKVLKAQHDAGRNITEQLLAFRRTKAPGKEDSTRIVKLLTDFNKMYRPHEAREDTILFPALRKIISGHEFDSLSEEFEKEEHKKFGEKGFESMLANVAGIEKELGIYELSNFTPNTPIT
jgi:hemerythrin-like domain-containing protein